jgi:hypothetical protein
MTMSKQMTFLEFITLVRDVRDSQKRWTDHPQQASIETMALEQKLDATLAGGVIALHIEPTFLMLGGGGGGGSNWRAGYDAGRAGLTGPEGDDGQGPVTLSR